MSIIHLLAGLTSISAGVAGRFIEISLWQVMHGVWAGIFVCILTKYVNSNETICGFKIQIIPQQYINTRDIFPCANIDRAHGMNKIDCSHVAVKYAKST